MTPDQTALEQAAQQATPGPWCVDARVSTRVHASDRGVATTGGPQNNTEDDGGFGQNQANARFIALANPQTILAICRALRDAQATAGAAMDMVKRLGAETDKFVPYLKDGESPFERLVRERRDNDTLLGELAKAKTRAEQAEADLATARRELDEFKAAWEAAGEQAQKAIRQMADERIARKQAERERAESQARADGYKALMELNKEMARQFKAERDRAQAALREVEQRKDAAYEERNRLVAALATVFPAARTRTAIEGWSEDWHGCVYVMLPTGQASWHFHDSHAPLFTHVPEGAVEWDGHTTEEKYRRLAALNAGCTED